MKYAEAAAARIKEREFVLPLIGGVAVLRVPHPMGQENYDMIMAFLNAASTALIGKDATP